MTDRFNIGDVIQLPPSPGIDPMTGEAYYPIHRKITGVRKTGYSWVYPNARPGEDFDSENSNDEFLFLWKLVPPEDVEAALAQEKIDDERAAEAHRRLRENGQLQ